MADGSIFSSLYANAGAPTEDQQLAKLVEAGDENATREFLAKRAADQAPATPVGFESPEYKAAQEAMANPGKFSEQDSKRIDLLNDIHQREAADIADSLDNDDASVVAMYRANRDVYDSDPEARAKIQQAYRIAKSQPFSVGNVVEGFANGLVQLVPALAGSAKQAATDIVTGHGDKVFNAAGYAIQNTANDVGKAKDNIVRLFTTGSFQPKDDQGWQEAFDKAVQREDVLDQSAHGGPLVNYTDKEAEDVKKNSLVADPLNFIPIEGGLGLVADAVRSTTTGAKVFRVVNQAGQLIREIPVVSAAGRQITALKGAAREFTENAAIKTGTTLAETGKKVGAFKGSAIGGILELGLHGAGVPGAGLVTGAVVPKTMEMLGNSLVNTGLKSQGVVPWGPLVRTARTVADSDLVQAAKHGVKGALGLTGDPLAAGYTALNVAANADGDGRKLGESLGSNAAFGAVAGAAGSKIPQEAPDVPLRKLGDFTPEAREGIANFKDTTQVPTVVKSEPYGVMPGFDEMHAENLKSMAPEAQQEINKFREQFRKDAQIYVLAPEQYAQALIDHASYENRKNGPLSDEEAQSVLQSADASKGVFVSELPDANGKTHKVVLLNKDGSALGHETGHLVDSLLSPEDRSELRKIVRKSYTSQEIAAAKDRYEQLLGQPISEPAAIDELVAENFSKILSGVPVDQLGAPREVSGAAISKLEKAYGENSKVLGVGAKPEIGAFLSKKLAKDELIRPVEKSQEPNAPTQTPAPQTPTAPTPTAPKTNDLKNIRVSREQQNEFTREARGGAPEDVGEASAKLALQDPAQGYTPIHKNNFETIRKQLTRPQPGPIEVNYNSVKSKEYAEDRVVRRAEQAVPEAEREAVQKIFVPYRFETDGKNRVQVLAMSLDKVRQNIDTLVSELVAHNATDLSPYRIRGGKLEPADAHQLIKDIQTYTANQANGFGGAGERVNVPQGYYGSVPNETAGFVAQKLSPERARFINLLMGRDLGPPKTARAVASRPVPANVSARQLAEANKRAIEDSLLAKPGQKFADKFGGGSIVETNPLRNEVTRRGVSVAKLHEVTERLNLKNISNVKPRPDLNFSRPSTDLIRAGFMPDVSRRTKNPEVAHVAEDYMREAGLPYQHFDGYAKMPETLGKRLADWFDKAPSDPSDPAVRNAYRSLIDQVKSQYEAMRKAGYEIEPWTGKGEPYKSSADMVRDVRDNKHLWFFLTDQGFGSDAHFDVSKNPMLEPSGVNINGKELVANDLFRAVHDFFGHAKEGYEFGPRGEYNAFLAHSTMFSKDALPALGAETLAQNSWVNFGPHLRREDGSLPVKGDADFKPLQERPFADQKVTIVPPDLLRAALDNGFRDEVQTGTKFMPATEESRGKARFLYKETFKNRKGEVKTISYYQTPGTAENPRGLTVDDVTARAEGYELGGENEKNPRPFVYSGEQERSSGSPIKLYTITEQVGNHPAGSTVARETLIQHGYEVPEETGAKFMPKTAESEHAATLEDFTPEKLPQILDKDNWAILTAENPNGKALSAEENAARNAKLESDLRSKGLEFLPVKGKYGGNSENSFIVLGVSPDQAHAIGNKFEQQSVLTSNGLEFNDGTANPARAVQVLESKPADNFTELPDGTAFKVDIDFDKKVNLRDSNQSGKLMNAVGGNLRLVHLSANPEISKLSTTRFGKGMATSRDLRGAPKIFFFQEGSPLGGDNFWASDRHMYGTKVSGDKIYDANEDTLGYWGEPNREAADEMLQEHGYEGLAVKTGDGRRVVALYKDADVKPIGKFAGGERIGSQLSFMPRERSPEEQALFNFRTKARELKEKYPEAQPLEFAKDAEGNLKLDDDGNPRIVKQSYDLYNTPLAKQAGKSIRNDEKRENAIADAYADKLVQTYDSIKDRPEVMAGGSWYRVAREKIQKVFGNDSLLFAQLLGATSAQTPVADNFRQAIDAYRQFKSGKFDDMVAKYKEGLSKLADGSLMKESGAKTEAAAMKWWIDQHNLIPTKSNGKKFNANSHAVLRVLAGNWADTVAGPKTPNFAGNLAGTTLEATIDVWAARLLHRVGSEKPASRWRILPDSETGVSDPDFYLGQAAYRKAAQRLGVSPDDLQAILWFAEKDHWEKKGWTRGAGAEKSDFNYFLDRTKREGDQVSLDEKDKNQAELAL